MSLVLSDIQTSPWEYALQLHCCDCIFCGNESCWAEVGALATCGSFRWDKEGALKEWASASADAGGSASARAVTPSESAKEDKVSSAVHSHTAPRCCCFPTLVQTRHIHRYHCLACLSAGPPKLYLSQALFRLMAPHALDSRRPDSDALHQETSLEQDGWMAQCCSSLAEQLHASQAAHVDMEGELACLREALASAQAQARGPQHLVVPTHPPVPALTLSSSMLIKLFCAKRPYEQKGGSTQSAHWPCLLAWHASPARPRQRSDPACVEPQARVADSRDEGWLEACCASLAQELRAAQDDNAALQQELDAARAVAVNLPPGPCAMSMSSRGASSEASSADASPMAWRGRGGAGEGEVEALRAELAVRMHCIQQAPCLSDMT